MGRSRLLQTFFKQSCNQLIFQWNLEKMNGLDPSSALLDLVLQVDHVFSVKEHALTFFLTSKKCYQCVICM